MRLPSRRTFWLSAATFLLAIVACAWFFGPRSRVTQENFDRIFEGMSELQVEAMLGRAEPLQERTSWNSISVLHWKDGPSWILVIFRDGEVAGKRMQMATTRERLTWYAKKGAKRIGVEWQ
jgi:hypothetical protein